MAFGCGWLAQRDPELPRSLFFKNFALECASVQELLVEGLGAVNTLLLGRSSGDLEESWSWLRLPVAKA